MQQVRDRFTRSLQWTLRLFATLVLVLAFGQACHQDDQPAGPNEKACRTYIQHLNDLACRSETALDPTRDRLSLSFD